jgi:hypothetical protein
LAIAPLHETIDVAPLSASRPTSLPAGASTSMSAAELQVLGPDSTRWLDLAMNSAGAFVGQRRIFVDGLPADALPDAARISQVAVNGDPFSAEFGGVDRIDISTSAPDRHWRFTPADRVGLPGADALVARPPPDMRRRPRASGPFRTVGAFFAQGSSFRRPAADGLRPESGSVGLDAIVPATSTTRLAGTSVNRTGLAWRAQSTRRRASETMGGLTAPAAGQRRDRQPSLLELVGRRPATQ